MLTFIYLLSLKCWYDLVFGFAMSLVPAILAWFGSKAVFKPDEMKAEIETANAESAKLRAEVASVSQDLAAVRSSFADAKADLEGKSAKISSLFAEIDDHGKTTAALTASIAALTTDRDAWSSKFGKFEAEANGKIADLTADRDAALARFSKFEKEANERIANLSTDRDAWMSKYAALEKESASKMAILSSERDAWSSKYASFETESAQKLTALATDRDAWSLKYANFERDAQADFATLTVDREQWVAKAESLEAEKAALTSTLTARQNEVVNLDLRLGEMDTARKQAEHLAAERERELHHWNTRYADWEKEKAGYLAQIETHDTRYAALKSEYDALFARFGDAEKRQQELAAQLERSRAFSCMGKLYRWNDLEIVEGIGPKIEEILRGAGILSWRNLADTPVEQLRTILSRAGERFKMADPTTWPEQARLALEEDCDNLRILQESLSGGRNVQVERVSYKAQAREMQRTLRAAGLDAQSLRRAREKETARLSARYFGRGVKLDDHQVVEGIGPKIDELLRNAGIMTWQQLSETDPARIKEILEAAGPRFKMHDPTTWPLQAQMADQNEWEKLKSYQDELTAGRAAE